MRDFHQNDLDLGRRMMMDWHGKMEQDLERMRIVGLAEQRSMR